MEGKNTLVSRRRMKGREGKEMSVSDGETSDESLIFIDIYLFISDVWIHQEKVMIVI